MASVFVTHSRSSVKENGWSDRIHHVLDAVRHIIIKNPFGLSETETDDLVRQLDQLELRLNENRLKIAMIGAFSSGKSTFINALLGQKIVKSAKRACTAAVTEICHGPVNEIRVKMKDGHVKQFPTNTEQAAIDAEFTGFLEKYQADNTYAEQVESIRVVLQKDILDNDAILLDTPGFNSGVDIHQEVIERVLSREADAGVFLFSAQIAADMKELEILERFRDKLGNIFFVVTKIDKADDTGEAQDVIKNVQLKLMASFDLAVPPRVTGIAPLRVLKDPNGKYASTFAEFQHTLFTFSKTRKLFVLTRNAIAVIDNIIATMRKSAEVHERKLSNEENRLETLKRVDPEIFIKMEKELARNTIRNATQMVAEQLNQDIDEAWSAYGRFFLCLVDKVGAIELEYLNQQGKECFDDLWKSLRDKWAYGGVGRLEAEANKIAMQFENRFIDYYNTLQKLEVSFGEIKKIVIPPRLSPILHMENMLTQDLLSLQQKLSGWFGGIKNFFSGTRKKIKEKWENELALIRDELRANIASDLEAISQDLMIEIVYNRVNQYAINYTEAIQAEIRFIKENLNDIREQIKAAKTAMLELNQHKISLEQEITGLEALEAEIRQVESGDVKLSVDLWERIAHLTSLCEKYDYDESFNFLLKQSRPNKSSPALLCMAGVFNHRCGEPSVLPFTQFLSTILNDTQSLMEAIWRLGQADFTLLAETYPKVKYCDAPLPAKELLAHVSRKNACPEIAMDLEIRHLTGLIRQGTDQLSDLMKEWR